jgi:hypothetical protein
MSKLFTRFAGWCAWAFGHPLAFILRVCRNGRMGGNWAGFQLQRHMAVGD